MKIVVAKEILKVNDQLAQRNREQFDRGRVFAVNVLGSPGSGKTTLLEALLPHVLGRARVAVVEGDLSTTRDADRVEAAGARAIQVNTDGGCHLDANMVASAVEALGLDDTDLLFIENVGNLVCTAGFKLGEHLRLVVLSVTEGDDKVEKYPAMFQRADALFLNKLDLLPHTDFDPGRVADQLRRIAPHVEVLRGSARTGDGVPECAAWLLKKREQCFRAR